jgi:hypothetical protein
MKRSPVRKRRPGGPRRGPWRSVKYRRWIAEHLCRVGVGGVPGNRLGIGICSQAAHTSNNGTSSKGADSSCIPLCPEHHREYDAGRKAFEKKYGVDLKAIAAQYFQQWLSEGNTP